MTPEPDGLLDGALVSVAVDQLKRIALVRRRPKLAVLLLSIGAVVLRSCATAAPENFAGVLLGVLIRVVSAVATHELATKPVANAILGKEKNG